MKCDREKKPHEFKRVQRVLDALRGGQFLMVSYTSSETLYTLSQTGKSITPLTFTRMVEGNLIRPRDAGFFNETPQSYELIR